MRYHLRSTAKGGRGVLLTSRRFGTSSPRHNNNYAATLQNLRIGSKTRVIFQGFTGHHATANAKESIEWGTNIVGGVVPGREAQHLGLPVLPSVRRAMEELKPDATGIYVPASMAAHAIEEAIEAEVPLIVAVAEHVPLHDMLRIHGMLKTQTKSRLVGPNSPGIINAAEGERCRIGFQPLPCFSPGCVGIAARSGTLSYEAVASTTRAGLGQSLCIGVGGDVLPGTDLVEALQVLEADPNTRAIALIGEVGGDGEVLAAQWIREYHGRTPVAQRKPVVALIAGKQAPMDRVMGHAGAFWLPGEPHPNQKIAALKNAGVTLVVNHPSKIGPALRQKLFNEPEEGASLAPSRPSVVSSVVPLQQSRGLHLDRAASEKLLADEDKTTDLQFESYPIRYLALGIDRATRSQCLTTAVIWGERMWRSPMSFNKILLPPTASDGLLSLTQKETKSLLSRLIEQLQIPETGSVNYRLALGRVLRNLGKVFKEKEAKHLGLQFAVNQKNPAFSVQDLRVELDEAAYRSGGRLGDVHEAFGALEARDPGARQAERGGIVYHRLDPGDRACNIGTLSNGAGLAMNTVDALADAGGKVANFLDTGGKATGETVRKSLETILQDGRVGVVFVNVFGGLTRGDTIAQGVIHAYKELRIRVPVVIRIRGTNEREGQRIIAGSGLPLYAYDDFGEAAAMAVELAKGGRPPAPRAYPEFEAETKVAELKDAIQTAAEDIMEHGGFEVDGTGPAIVAATEVKATISEAAGPQVPTPAETSQLPDEEATKAAVNDASQKQAAE
ncbi:hypothetical protein VPNG_01822 [Cytospora leucostoma]|uniref:CoA-binding domain-containing protein n=1 Tax=Cytospora leucostoma TaxID=1230097 RepID=A0A423XJ13_9PEZI|nr:hypothetical protein VPNG_01822 [Cytospora leucostoma]